MAAVARSHVKQTDQFTAAQEPFPLHVPSHRNGREDSPGMALAHHRRTVGTGRQIERIAVEKRIGNSTHEGGKSRVCIAATCPSVRTVGCCSEVVVAEAVAGKSFHLCPESSHLLFLVFSKPGGREVVYAPAVSSRGRYSPAFLPSSALPDMPCPAPTPMWEQISHSPSRCRSKSLR